MGRTVKPTDPIPSGDCRLEYQYAYGAGYVGLLGAWFEPGDEFDCTPEEARILLAQEGNFVLISGTPAEPPAAEEEDVPTETAPVDEPVVPPAPPAATQAPAAPTVPAAPAAAPASAPAAAAPAPSTEPTPAADQSATPAN